MKYRDCYEWTQTEQGKYIRYASKWDLIIGIVSVIIPALLLGWLIPYLDNIVVFVLGVMSFSGLFCNSILLGMYLRERVVFD